MIGDTRSPERAAKVARVVDEVIDLSPADRAARLDALCAGDTDLRRSVEAILAYDIDDETPFRAAIDVALDAASGAAAEDAAGRRVGAYRLVREIGRGGMGTVYLAARADEEFDQQVAIKVVRGLLGTESLRRFRAERQILASLVHPNIARLLDGGTTDEGVPFFVMEHVAGVPLDQYCEQRQLPVPDRLHLFLQVCDAVAHAHGRLVVHRDLKPSNILVTDDGTPKLLDFGIAKLLEEDGGTDAAPQTIALGQVFTPEYASPEQVRGERVTTSTDIYSLGVVLYELLAGMRPYAIASNRPDEIVRVVCEQLPPKPSVASGRTDLQGDLDTIVMAAIEKEPARRFHSAEAMADDIRRHLAGEPVLVRPSTLAYRTSRFVRRHRLAVSAAAAVLVLLMGWAVTVSVQARRVARERDTAMEVTAFLVDLFASSDPMAARSANITARELIDRGAERLNALEQRPEIHARLLDTIGKVYRSLGAGDRSAAVLRESLAVRERIDGPGAATTAETINELAEALREGGKYEDAEPLYRRALEIRRAQFGPRSQEAAGTLNDLGLVMNARDRRDEAQQLFTEALAIRRERLGPQHPDVAVTMSNLAIVARSQAKYDEAERLIRDALEIRLAVLGDAHPQTGNSYMALGQLLDTIGRKQEAEPLMLKALEIRRKVYRDHPLIDIALSNLASLRQDLGDLDGAEALYRESIANQQKRMGRHPEVAMTINNLGTLLEEKRALPDAEAMFRESLAMRREFYGPRHSAVARAMHNLSRSLVTQGKYDEAAPLARDALAMRRALLGPKHPETAQTLVLIARLQAAQGNLTGAEQLVREALALHRDAYAPNHPTTIASEYELGLVLLKQGRAGEAMPHLQAALDERSKRLPEGHWLRVETEAAMEKARR